MASKGESGKDCPTSDFNSPKSVRRQSRKRRGRKRRLDPNPIWEHAVKYSEGSDSSLDEALKDYMDNVTSQQQEEQSDSGSDDTAMMKRLSSLNVTSSSNLYGESDSVTENHTKLKKTGNKRKKRFKRLVVDSMPAGSGCMVRSSSMPDFMPENWHKRPRVKKVRSRQKEASDVMSTRAKERPGIKGEFGFDILATGSRKMDSKVRSKVAPAEPVDFELNCGEMDFGKESCARQSKSLPESSGSMESQSTDNTMSKERTRSSSSDGATATEVPELKSMDCSSNDSDVTMAQPLTPKNDETSSTYMSSSDEDEEEDDGYTNDEGREGDDEQSDFYHEPGSVSGIPSVVPWWDGKTLEDYEQEQTFQSILTGSFQHLSKPSQRAFHSKLRGCQGLDDSQIVRGCRGRLKAKRLKKSSLASFNEKIIRFLHNPYEKELSLHSPKTGERNQVFQLASMYSLDVRTEGGGHKSKSVLTKTRHTIDYQGAGMDDLVFKARQSFYPQFAKRRRKSPPPALAAEGAVGGEAQPIPNSSIGNRMLQSMGWTPGSGLGADGTGIREPVQAYLRPKNRGLGYCMPK